LLLLAFRHFAEAGFPQLARPVVLTFTPPGIVTSARPGNATPKAEDTTLKG
jgi:hypothetical protein